jgi:transcriptional regulator with XRE-family HTH domain
MSWTRIVGWNIRKWRWEKGLTQEDLARRAATTANFIGQIEHGDRNISIEVMGRVAQALGIELVRLLDPEDASPAPVGSRTPVEGD